MVVTRTELSEQREQWLALISDTHLGNNALDERRLKADFKRASELDALIAINGDVFDAILPKDQKRYVPEALHPRYQGKSDVINEALDHALEIFGPYKDRIAFIGCGNHEASVKKHHSFDMISALIDRLGGSIAHGGWLGYWLIRFKNQSKWQTFKIRYHHGAGGAAPVTKGMIDANRMRTFIPDADVIWVGHKHNRLVDKHVVERITDQGRVHYSEAHFIMSGSYLTTYGGEHGDSYAAQWNVAPQPKGGVFVRLSLDYEPANKGFKKIIHAEV